MEKICKYCNTLITYNKKQQLGAHIGNCSKNPNRKIQQNKKEYILNCNRCNNQYIVNCTEYLYSIKKYKKYCSTSCANKRKQSNEHKIKTSNSLKLYYKNNPRIIKPKIKIVKPPKVKNIKLHDLTCTICDNQFKHQKKTIKTCSKECLKKLHKQNGSLGGKKMFHNKQNVNNNNQITYIYALLDEHNNIRYIGKSNNVKHRFNIHLKEAKKKRTHKEKWINSMLENNIKPNYIILDECLSSDWILFEQYWIDQTKAWGFSLTNGTSGGEGSNGFKGKTHSNETKNKIRNKLKLYYNNLK